MPISIGGMKSSFLINGLSLEMPVRAATYCKALYKQRHKIENMFSRLKDWRRIATRYDRCAHTYFSAICIAATVIFWCN